MVLFPETTAGKLAAVFHSNLFCPGQESCLCMTFLKFLVWFGQGFNEQLTGLETVFHAV